MLKKSTLFFILVCTAFSFKYVKSAAGEDKFNFGISNNLTLGSFGAPSNRSMGLFFNYNMSRKLSLQMEVESETFLPDILGNQVSESSFPDDGLQREWAMSLALNYQMKPLLTNLRPFICLGAGKYYIQGSKAMIKQGKTDPQERGLDYEMRDQFKRSGFFGALGLKFQANSRTALFIQTKCSVLFDRNDLMGHPSKFTDLLNISTGLRFHLN